MKKRLLNPIRNLENLTKKEISRQAKKEKKSLQKLARIVF